MAKCRPLKAIMPKLTTLTITTQGKFEAGVSHPTGYTPIRVIDPEGTTFVICGTGPERCSQCIIDKENLEAGCQVPLDPELRR